MWVLRIHRAFLLVDIVGVIDLGHNLLGFEVPDDDSRIGTSAQPVTVRGEAQRVDDVLSVEGVQVDSIGQVPKHGSTVLTTRSAERTIRRDSDGVDVTSVTNQVLLELELVTKAPDLHDLVPASGDNGRLVDVRRELHAGDPVGVGVIDDNLALAKGVPEADRLVAGTRNDLSVVGGEGNGEDVLGVTNEASVSLGLVQIPQADGGVYSVRTWRAIIRTKGIPHEADRAKCPSLEMTTSST